MIGRFRSTLSVSVLQGSLASPFIIMIYGSDKRNRLLGFEFKSSRFTVKRNKNEIQHITKFLFWNVSFGSERLPQKYRAYNDTTLYQASSFNLTSGGETNDSGKSRFEVQKYRTSG